MIAAGWLKFVALTWGMSDIGTNIGLDYDKGYHLIQYRHYQSEMFGERYTQDTLGLALPVFSHKTTRLSLSARIGYENHYESMLLYAKDYFLSTFGFEYRTSPVLFDSKVSMLFSYEPGKYFRTNQTGYNNGGWQWRPTGYIGFVVYPFASDSSTFSNGSKTERRRKNVGSSNSSDQRRLESKTHRRSGTGSTR